MDPKYSHENSKIFGVWALVVLNAGIFIFTLPLPKGLIFELCALSRQGILEGGWWQFVTHAFLHADWWHLAFNILGIWLAGRILERKIGTAKFLLLYFFSVLSGGLFQIILGLPDSEMIGASGGVSGIIFAFSLMFPNLLISTVIIPIRFRAKYLGWGIAFTSLFFVITGWQPEIGHAAHLGGCIAGYIGIRILG